MLQEIICSTNDDVSRFVAFFEEQISAGRLKRTKRFDITKGKIELLPDERSEAKKEKNRIEAEKEKK
jgi:hypothetical protein